MGNYNRRYESHGEKQNKKVHCLMLNAASNTLYLLLRRTFMLLQKHKNRQQIILKTGFCYRANKL